MRNSTDQVRQIWQSLELPGLIDVHTHFMPKPVLDALGIAIGWVGRPKG